MGDYFLMPAREQCYSTSDQGVIVEKNALEGLLILLGWENHLCIGFAGPFLTVNRIAATAIENDCRMAMVKCEGALRQNCVRIDVVFL